jgi:predicted nucleic acid-binding protein
MVLVDSSVFIRLFRKESAPIAERLSALVIANQAAICGPVWVEFLGGFSSFDRRQRYQDALSGYPWLETTRETFELAAEWAGRRRGIGVIDAVIAATARVHRAGLLTTDRAFLQFAEEQIDVEFFG